MLYKKAGSQNIATIQPSSKVATHNNHNKWDSEKKGKCIELSLDKSYTYEQRIVKLELLDGFSRFPLDL
jgi:hypothetical protein